MKNLTITFTVKATVPDNASDDDIQEAVSLMEEKIPDKEGILTTDPNSWESDWDMDREQAQHRIAEAEAKATSQADAKTCQ
jgi:hypothetical protein